LRIAGKTRENERRITPDRENERRITPDKERKRLRENIMYIFLFTCFKFYYIK